MTPLIVCAGKLREPYWREAMNEYQRRLSRLGGLEIVECPDLPEPKNISAAALRRVMDAEGEAMLAHIKQRDHVIALCVEGVQLDSNTLANRLKQLEDNGNRRVVFMIGGSNGLSEAALSRANERISFSRLTFPHQLVRVMLAEQIYRSRKILSGERYHK